jgi:Protein  of unknown function (DUF3018)
MTSTHMTPSQKQQRYRNRLKRHGLRPVQIWVPDTSAPNFVEECHRQARMLAHATGERETMEFIDAITDWSEK